MIIMISKYVHIGNGKEKNIGFQLCQKKRGEEQGKNGNRLVIVTIEKLIVQFDAQKNRLDVWEQHMHGFGQQAQILNM